MINSRKNIFFIFFVFMLLINDSFFYLLGNTNTTIIVSFLSIICLIPYLNKIYLYKVLYLIPFLLLICCGSITYSYVEYGQPFIDGLAVCHRYFIYFFIFVLLQNIRDKKDIKVISDIVIYTSIIFIFIAFVQYFVYPNVIFFKDYVERNGHLRLYTNTSTILFAYIFLVGRVFSKFRLADFLKIVLIFLYIIFINQGRGEIIFYSVIFCISLIVKIYIGMNKLNKKIMLLMSPILIFIGLGLVSIIFKNELSTIIAEINSNSGSGFTRVKELIYYGKALVNSPLFGMGMLSGDLAKIVYRTYDLYYYMEDTGLLEFVFKTGVFGFIWILIYFYFVIKYLIVIYKAKDYEGFYTILTYILFNLLGLFYYNILFSRLYVFLNVTFMSLIICRVNFATICLKTKVAKCILLQKEDPCCGTYKCSSNRN